jgi:hypothetical protein
MNQYKVSFHDCQDDFKTTLWKGRKAVSIGKLVRKRITTKIVLEIFKSWDSFPERILESPVRRNYLKRTQIKEYEPV